MTSAIQAIRVPAYEDRTDPSPHTVYRIQITANVREWPMWRRYSEFVDLHMELTKSTGSPPPAALPPKNSLSMFRSRSNPASLEQRRVGLETYLRAILSAKEDKWRETYAFKQFLGIPIGKNTVIEGRQNTASSSKTSTLVSWLDEHMELQSSVRDVRADINKRDALSDRGDVSKSHQTNVQAKKKLLAIQTRLDAIEGGLKTLAMAGMSEGELQRRTEMVVRLRDDCDKLTKMVTVARQTSRELGRTLERNPAPESDRDALLGNGLTTFSKPGRVLGAPPPQETEETRPLDDPGLLQLQQAKIDDQDANLSQLSAILQRQMHLGLAIDSEIKQQIEMLDQLDNDVDRFGGKLTTAKKQMNRL